MRSTLADLLERAERLANHGTTLRGSLDRHQQAPAIADRKLAEFNRTEAFNVAPEAHKAAVRGRTLQKILDAATVAAGVDLFLIETQAPVLARNVAALRAQARRAVDPVDHYLARTGGTALHLTDQTDLAIRQFDITTRLYLLTATRDWTPSRLADEYARALDSDSDEAGVMVRFIEDVGYRGTAASTQEIAEAARLRRLIDEAQASRVPRELETIEVTIDDATRLANKAKSLYHVTPIDPSTDPAVLSTHREVVAAMTADLEGQPA